MLVNSKVDGKESVEGQGVESQGEVKSPAQPTPRQRRIVGIKPSPRALIVGFDDQRSLQLAELFQTSQRVGNFGAVREAEWDVIVTTASTITEHRGGSILPAPHLYILAFGGVHDIHASFSTNDSTVWSLGCSRLTLAREFEIPPDLPADVERLVLTDLLPWAQKQHVNAAIQFEQVKGVSHGNWYNAKANWQPFLQTADRETLAGSFRRGKNQAETWLLPTTEVDVVGWAKVAISHWHELDSKRFPYDLSWRQSERWLTPRELEVKRKLALVLAEREKTLAGLLERERQLQIELAELGRAAAALERVLLIGQGTPLVEAVARALEAVGFIVEPMDAKQPANDRREDLRVTAPGDSEWIALVEVRGYRNGAQLSDLMRLGRFRGRYLKETGREPTACWYIVNQFVGVDPGSRQKPLGGNLDEVHEFATDGGLIIDTRDLFALWNAIESGTLTPNDARSMLRESRGVFEMKLN